MEFRGKFKSVFRLSRSVPAISAPSPVPTAQEPTPVGLYRDSGIITQLVRASATVGTVAAASSLALTSLRSHSLPAEAAIASATASTATTIPNSAPTTADVATSGSRSPSIKNVEALSPAIASAIIDTTTPAPSPSPSLATGATISTSPFPPVKKSGAAQPAIERTSTPWERALNKLQPEDCAGIDFRKDNKIDLLHEFVRETERNKQECEKKRWGYYDSGGEKVFYADILLTQLNKYVAIGDVAIQSNPQVVALAWAGFRLLLQVATADMENMRLVFESLEYLVRILSRCDIYEKLYAERDLQAARLLNTSLVNLYVSVLRYLCCARRELGNRTATRILKSVFSDLGQLFKEIQEHEKDVGNDADTAEKESAEMESFAQEGRTIALRRLLVEIQEPIYNIERLVSGMYTFVQDAKRIEILLWLSRVPFQDHHSFFRARRHGDTGHWLVQNDKFWKWRSSRLSSILWLRGDAGAGKTMLASKIIDEFQSQKGSTQHAIAYFYCNYREEERRDPASILRALVKQLCLAVPEKTLPKSILSIYQKREDNGHISGPLSLGESKDLILELSAGFSQTTIVVDALDECNRATRRDLFRTLKQILTSTSHTRIFVTSRNDGDIRDMLVGLPSHYINATDNTKDIDTYINSEIENRFNEGLLPNDGDYMELKNEIISTLSKGAKGMFMWAHFQILEICEEHTPGNIRKALTRLPKDLNETYSRILKKVNDQTPDNVIVAKKVLKWLLYAKELNSPEIVSEFLSVIPGKPALDPDRWKQHQILDICQNLVVYDKGLNVLRFAHFSVQEFLLRHVEFSQEEEARASTIAAEVCLTVLIYHHSNTPRCPIPTLLKYAISNWSAQVRFSGAGSSTLEKLWKDFLKPSSAHYDAWASVIGGQVENLQGSGAETISPLWVACYYQLYDIFKFLLDGGAAPNCYNHEMKTPLHHAAKCGYSDFVQLLMTRQGVDASAKDGEETTPLIYAIKEGHEEVVRILIGKDGVGLNTAGGRCSWTPLSWAAKKGKEGVVQMLLEKGAVDLSGGLASLLLACLENNEKVIQVLLEQGEVSLKGFRGVLLYVVEGNPKVALQTLLERGGADSKSVQRALSEATKRGLEEEAQILRTESKIDTSGIRTALLLANNEGHEAAVGILLNNGGSSLGNIRKVLSLAVDGGYKKVVQILLDKCEVGSGDVRRALSLAAEGGHEEIVQLFLEKDVVDPESLQEALSSAAGEDHKEIVQMLLEKCEVGSEGVQEALSSAARGGHRRVVQVLLEKCELSSEGVQEALSSAAGGGHEEVVQVLLEKCELSSEGVEEALSFAIERGHEEVVQVLLEKYELSSEGVEEALSSAAWEGHKGVVQVLLEKCELSSEGVEEALSFAIERGHEEVVQVLLEKCELSSEGVQEALSFAVERGHKGVVQVLLEKCELSSEGVEEALSSVAGRGHEEAVQVVLEKGGVGSTG